MWLEALFHIYGRTECHQFLSGNFTFYHTLDHFGHIHLITFPTDSLRNNNGNKSLQKKRINNKVIHKHMNYYFNNIGSATHTF